MNSISLAEWNALPMQEISSNAALYIYLCKYECMYVYVPHLSRFYIICIYVCIL